MCCQDVPEELPGPVDFASLGLSAFLSRQKTPFKQICIDL